MSEFKFLVTMRDRYARVGTLTTPHGIISTPCFMPVGTNCSVKGISYQDLYSFNYPITLVNTYHILAKGARQLIENAGGIHSFIGWKGSVLSDSGGYQMYSLVSLSKKSDQGVIFVSPWDGSKILVSPESSLELQAEIGVDIAMCFDDCISSTASFEEHQLAVERSSLWAQRCSSALHSKNYKKTTLFGIIQGGQYLELRLQSLNRLLKIGFFGYALGGFAVGESRNQRNEILSQICDHMPQNSPRYLMGVGTPVDILDAISYGIDLFDCVLPTRNARNGYLFTSQGIVRIKNSKFQFDNTPLDKECCCVTCVNHTKSYLHYLFKHKQLTVYQLLTIHNLTYYSQLCIDARSSIAKGCFEQFRQKIFNVYVEK
ncbi:MAG: tRNA guanosine(34) transglycosylase Tgt [Methylacidiphilales bacterium]|nr:tRNA guanosine(34) transglycosylase Tgt [Candidatus Methylacidiphilales bacterium]